MNIRNRIEKLLARGTHIAGFTYHGKPRNVIIGANIPTAGIGNGWGARANRAIRTHKGREFLICRVNNEENAYSIKCFDLAQIVNPSF